MRTLPKLVIFVVMLTQTNGNIWNNFDLPENNSNILEKWEEIDKLLKGTASSLIKNLMPKILELSSRLNLSSECMQQSLQLVTGMKNMKTWAFSMMDASAKIPQGIASATLTHLGGYEQCLDIMVPHAQHKDQIQFQGQYCLVQLRFPLPPKTKKYGWYDQLEELKNFTGSEFLTFMSTKAHLNYRFPLTMGLCIPSGCSREDLKKLIHDQVGNYHFLSDVTHCEIKNEEIHFKAGQIVAILLCCILASLVLLGTLLEMKSKSDVNKCKNRGFRTLLCFSVIANFRKLMSTKRTSENLQCLHGIRFLSVTWVVLAHTYYYPGTFMTRYNTLFRLFDFTSEFFIQILTNGSESVDVFLFMGGMLLSYLTLKTVKVEGKKFNVKYLIFHRIWRIAPAYYFILLCGLLTPLMGSGPMFRDTMETVISPCFQYWWRNVLFINTFFDKRDMCMVHYWYVACDMQLFLFSILILLVFIRWEKAGVFATILIIVFSIIYTGTVTYIMDLTPVLSVVYDDPEDTRAFFLHTYGSPFSRAGPYFIGIFTGYLLITRPDIKIPKSIQVTGWFLATMTCLTIIFIPSAWYKVYTPHEIDFAVYAAFYKVSFTAGIAWMIFCCITGRGGFINEFLSWKLWVPLGKLTFLIYLIHPYIINTFIANFKAVQEVNHFLFVIHFFGYLCISGLLAFIVTLLIEFPFAALEKVLFINKERKEEHVNEKNNEPLQNGDLAVKPQAETVIMTDNIVPKVSTGMSQNEYNIKQGEKGFQS